MKPIEYMTPEQLAHALQVRKPPEMQACAEPTPPHPLSPLANAVLQAIEQPTRSTT